METNNEVENFLAHFGKIGMKWGHRSGSTAKSGTAVAQVATQGLYLGNKAKYKTPKAQALRKDAGRSRLYALGLTGAGLAAHVASLTIKNPTVSLGAKAVGSILEISGGIAGWQSAIRGVKATNANR